MATQLVWDYRAASEELLSDADRALCDYAVRLTHAPGEMGRKDIDELKAQGFTDAQITIAVQVIGYFNYINRMADGLGVDLDPGMDALFGGIDFDDWRKRKAKF